MWRAIRFTNGQNKLLTKTRGYKNIKKNRFKFSSCLRFFRLWCTGWFRVMNEVSHEMRNSRCLFDLLWVFFSLFSRFDRTKCKQKRSNCGVLSMLITHDTWWRSKPIKNHNSLRSRFLSCCCWINYQHKSQQHTINNKQKFNTRKKLLSIRWFCAAENPSLKLAVNISAVTYRNFFSNCFRNQFTIFFSIDHCEESIKKRLDKIMKYHLLLEDENGKNASLEANK